MATVWQLVDSSTLGGIERHIEMLATGLIRVGYPCKVVLYDNHGDNPWFHQLDAAGIPYIVLNGGIRNLTRAIRRHRPGLIHTHGYKAGILGRAVARLCATPVVSTFHSGERAAFPVSLYQSLDEMSAFLAPAIAVSEPIFTRLPKSAEIIHNFVTMPTAHTDLARIQRRIGFVGRFSHEKGPDRFALLAGMLHDAPDLEATTWHAFGDGPMRAAIESASQGLLSCHGLQTDMTPIWPMLDLLVMPSRAEGLPLAALEAHAHGIPVVAARCGALPDVIEHGRTGWLFDPDDLEAAAAAILKWAGLDAETRHAMFDACRKNARERYAVEARLPQILDVYRRSGLAEAA